MTTAEDNGHHRSAVSAGDGHVPVTAAANGQAHHVAGAGVPAAALPEPGRDRWQPLRLGLLNLYRFDHEELRFEDGRLLLRGNNGTGKSRVLALTMPFLLDGRTAPHRLEPDGDHAKRLEWNLLLGRHDDRLGYSWIEFGRRDGGDACFMTLGCGLRAVKGRGIAQQWFFVTDRRVGDDLFLQARTGQALTRDRLRDALGERGEVFETAAAYRAEVDSRLFGLGDHRYGALVDLLVQLRRPQLSRQLDEEALSAALSEALPPLPAQVLGDVAEAFRTIEQDRDDLAGFQAAAAATRGFMDAYGRYAAVAVRRRAGGVTFAHAGYERTQRRLRDQEEARTAASERLGRVESERGAAATDERRAAEQVAAFEASPELRSARELERARKRARELDELADRTAEEADAAAMTVADRVARATAAEEAAGSSRTEVVSLVTAAGEAASGAALDRDHDALVAALDLPDGATSDAVVHAASGAHDVMARRREALDLLRDLSGAVAGAEQRLVAARREQDRITGELDGAQDQARAAADERDRRSAEAIDAYRGWASAASEVAPVPGDEVAWEMSAWRDDAAGRSPLERAVSAAVAEARQRLAGARADLGTRRRAADEERAETAAERDRVATARDLPPTPSHARAVDGRHGRRGAPLWQLVDLAGGVDAAAAAGFEASLEAAGLLDAWIAPDGTVLTPDVLDAALVPADAVPAPDGGLGGVLVATPPEDADVPAEVVAAVLARIGASEGAGDV